MIADEREAERKRRGERRRKRERRRGRSTDPGRVAAQGKQTRPFRRQERDTIITLLKERTVIAPHRENGASQAGGGLRGNPPGGLRVNRRKLTSWRSRTAKVFVRFRAIVNSIRHGYYCHFFPSLSSF